MKKKSILVLTLVLALVLVACGGNTAEAPGGDGASGDVVELSFSTAANENSTWHQGALKFVELVEEKTDGKYKINIFPMDQLSGGNQATGIELVQTGSTDIHLTDALVWSSIQPKTIVPAMPWLLPTYEDVDKYMEGEAGQELLDSLSESGVVGLALGESGYRQVVNTKNPIRTPEDMTGLKMRIPGSNVHVSLLKYLGSDPITMSSSEVYTATQQGTIDASENTVDLLLSQRTLEVSDYITFWNYSYDPIFLTVSQKLWGSLSEEEKTIFQEAAVEAMALQKELARQEADEALEVIKEEYPDVEIVEKLTDDELKKFKEVAAPVYEENKAELGDLLTKFGYEF
ncbi:MAG: DctP family TRAP transporter solute-binding subunit [Tissierellia bacterium]|nr:DctP family TRAP transporter solute-binding subunit [Tissierellia bacterium]